MTELSSGHHIVFMVEMAVDCGGEFDGTHLGCRSLKVIAIMDFERNNITGDILGNQSMI